MLPLVLSYAAVAVSSIVVFGCLVRRARKEVDGVDEAPSGLYEIAFLAGGPGRVADTAICALHHDGRLGVAAEGRVYVMRAEARDPVERELLALCGSAPESRLRLSELRSALMRSPAVQECGDALTRRGLLLRPEDHRRRRAAALAHYVVCAVVLLVHFDVFAEGARALTSGEVLAALPVAASALACAFLAPGGSRVSPAGHLWLRGHTGRSREGSPLEEVAVDGTEAVRDAALRYQLQWAAAPASRSASPAAATGSSDSGTATWCGTAGSGCGMSGGSGSDSGSAGGGCGGAGGGCGGGGGGSSSGGSSGGG
ncbi:TIGR04222 domain-containing membrane protein [Streptomyces macrosporus]|uniref:TIGR04222 domain-containing membrane protein n=1 Tax=Streptomyces macrosporus TaxID=44032 RepID=A0ABN3K5S5_9ACTN